MDWPVNILQLLQHFILELHPTVVALLWQTESLPLAESLMGALMHNNSNVTWLCHQMQAFKDKDDPLAVQLNRPGALRILVVSERDLAIFLTNILMHFLAASIQTIILFVGSGIDNEESVLKLCLHRPNGFIIFTESLMTFGWNDLMSCQPARLELIPNADVLLNPTTRSGQMFLNRLHSVQEPFKLYVQMHRSSIKMLNGTEVILSELGVELRMGYLVAEKFDSRIGQLTYWTHENAFEYQINQVERRTDMRKRLVR